MSKLSALIHLFVDAVTFPFRMVYRAFRKVYAGFCAIGRAIKATPGAIARSPLQAYRRVVAGRD